VYVHASHCALSRNAQKSVGRLPVCPSACLPCQCRERSGVRDGRKKSIALFTSEPLILHGGGGGGGSCRGGGSSSAKPPRERKIAEQRTGVTCTTIRKSYFVTKLVNDCIDLLQKVIIVSDAKKPPTKCKKKRVLSTLSTLMLQYPWKIAPRNSGVSTS
jgi:hypothetical protein